MDAQKLISILTYIDGHVSKINLTDCSLSFTILSQHTLFGRIYDFTTHYFLPKALMDKPLVDIYLAFKNTEKENYDAHIKGLLEDPWYRKKYKEHNGV